MDTLKYHDMTDQELVRESRAGSLSAFDELICRYEKRVYAFLRMKTPNIPDAEDLHQQVFIKAYRRLSRYDSCYAFYTWLLAIARREVAEFYRSYEEPPVEYENDMQVDERDPSAALAAQEQGETIWLLARQLLSDDQFTALLLVYHQDLSIKETAKVMKRTVSSVKVLLHRGRKKLVDQARVQGGDSEPDYAQLEDGPCFVA